MSYIFLASPYSSIDFFTKIDRWHAAMDACSWIAKFDGRAVYSPIAQWHPIAAKYDLPTDYEFWQNINHAFIASSAAVWVLTIDGWKDSKGVASEITFARTLCKPVLYLNRQQKTGNYSVGEQSEEFS